MVEAIRLPPKEFRDLGRLNLVVLVGHLGRKGRELKVL
jgi:hypothetical protein